MRRAVEQRRGQPRGPQIRGQLAQVHVIVAGDDPVSHVILRSMNVPHRAAMGLCYRVSPLFMLVSGGASPRPADGPDLPAPCSSAEELIAAIGLEPRNVNSGRYLEPLQNLPGSAIDSTQFALVTFPGGVPELSVEPGDPGDEAVGLDRAENLPCLRIDLMDLPIPILPHPERPFGPREPRVTAAAGRRDRGEHTAGLRIDLLDAILGELKQVVPVEGCSCMRADIDRAQRLPARRIEGVQPVSSSKPDVLTVIRDSMHVVGTR